MDEGKPILPATPEGRDEAGGRDEGGVPGAERGGDHEPSGPAPVHEPAVGERLTPLHEPDAYDTPPYGRPGPWAPAPPVQRPMAAAPPPFGAPAPGATPPPTDPWRTYDPWAARAPFQQNGAPMPGRRRRPGRALVLGAALVALVVGGIGGAVGSLLERGGAAGDASPPQAAGPARHSPGSVAGIAAGALPGVVTLHVKGDDGEGTGTGFVFDGQRHVLTNNHVVQAAGPGGRITATFEGGETATATVVGRDAGYDLAVVELSDAHGRGPLPLGDSDGVRVGDPVVAIGAPFGLAGTVTSGIISAKERPVTAGGKGDGSDVSYVDALQTDAPINPGNSGGPLLDAHGRVVGINSAIRSADDTGGSGDGGEAGSIGLGFAIPVNQAKRVAEELIRTGRATHPVIGVTLDMNYSGDGARVGARAASGGPAVAAGGPGAKAGIRAGDIVTEVDGVRVHSGSELIVRTRAHRPGDRLRLRVVRAGAERTITLVLGSAGGG
ncbi:trypsin-like peptidase domain-containing protein [Streptomyces sp. NPDC048664]|uniref:S1C family serine protease n=1 Tax=Streptomyces sp. NPDC048664 TaxID=3154505 RepID=UPI00342DB097